MGWQRHAAAALAALALVGCNEVGYGPGKLQPGASAEEVTRQMGKFAQEQALPDGGRVWWFVRGPQGFDTYKVVFGADGKVTSIMQVLSEKVFMTIPAGASQQQVLDLIGPPREKMRFANLQEDVWTWRYKDGTFNKLLHVHFNLEGNMKRTVFEQEPEF